MSVHPRQCVKEFEQIAAATLLFGRPDLAAARADPALARRKQHRLIAATGGVASEPDDGFRSVVIEPKSAGHAAGPPLVYLHGGGLVFYDVAIYRPWLELLADASQRTIIAIDYPRAPEAHPAEILAFVHAEARRVAGAATQGISLAGDSVGALLALWLATSGGIRAQGLLLIAPLLDLGGAAKVADTNGAVFGLDPRFLEWFRDLARQMIPDFDPSDPAFFRCHSLPPACIVSPTCDPLFEEAIGFVESAHGTGSELKHMRLAGLPHDFWFYPKFDAVRAAATAIGEQASLSMERSM